MTNPYNWVDDPTKVAVSDCNPDVLNEALMYLKYAVDNSVVVPVGTQLLFSSSAVNSRGLLNQDNSVYNRVDYQDLIDVIGLLYGKDCFFNPAATNFVTMSSNSSAGCTASASNTYSADEPWKLWDNNSGTYFQTNAGYITSQWAQLIHPATIFAGFSLTAPSNIATYMPYDADIELYTGVNGDVLTDIVKLRQQVFNTSETKGYLPNVIGAQITKTKLNMFNLNTTSGSAGVYTVAFNLCLPDFSKIKCTGHGFTTGNAVKVWSAGTLPTGLSASTTYYARNVDSNNITLHPTATDATNNTNAVSITGIGTGPFKIWAATTFPVGNVTGGKLAF